MARTCDTDHGYWTRPAAVDLGRYTALVGLPSPVRYLCDDCDRRYRLTTRGKRRPDGDRLAVARDPRTCRTCGAERVEGRYCATCDVPATGASR
jgi:hypothetical protein